MDALLLIDPTVWMFCSLIALGLLIITVVVQAIAHQRLKHELAVLHLRPQEIATPVPLSSPPLTDPLDQSAGLKMTGGKQKLFQKFLRDFRVKYQDVSPRFRTFLEDQNFPEIERLAHTLKGNAAMLGMKTLSAASALLETQAHQGSLEACAESIKDLQKALAPAFRALDRAIEGGETSPGSETPTTPEPMKNKAHLDQLLAQAWDLLDRGEYGAHGILGAIKSTYDLSSCQQEFLQICSIVDNGDYDEAVRDLRLLIDQGNIT